MWHLYVHFPSREYRLRSRVEVTSKLLVTLALTCHFISKSIGTKMWRVNLGNSSQKEVKMRALLRKAWFDDQGQDIAEYAVMLAVILVIVVGTIRLVGSNANNVFSETASAIGG